MTMIVIAGLITVMIIVAVKNNDLGFRGAAQVVLFDEVEKAHPGGPSLENDNDDDNNSGEE